MADDSLARNPSTATADMDADYDAIYATVVASERGRWFLDQYAQRHRGADTERVLAVLERIEQAIHGVGAPEPIDTVRSELIAMMEAIAIARDDVIGREADPAARGEAAIADFRHAVEQIRELNRMTPDAGSGVGAALSFQTNRLAVAGERLERSIGGLRALLGLLDELDQHLRHLVGEPRPVIETVAEPAHPVTDPPRGSAPSTWPLALQDAIAAPLLPLSAAQPIAPNGLPVDINSDQAAPPPSPASQPLSAPRGAPVHEPFWDLTIALPEPGPHQARAATDAAPGISVTDWAFAPADDASLPANAAQSLPVDDPVEQTPEPPPARLMSALERLEAREYSRHPTPATDAANSDGLDDLIVNVAPDPEESKEPPAIALSLSDSEWIVDPAPATPVEPTFDDGSLIAGDDGEATATALSPPEQAGTSPATEELSADTAERSQEPDFVAGPATAAEPDPDMSRAPSQPADSAVDTASMLERLESMRNAIAELMEEVSEKSVRRASQL
jgi:hypothetical protein